MVPLLILRIAWGQAPPPDPTTVALLALERWCSSLTLSSPEPTPSHVGLWTWLLGLAGLLLVAVVAQGPKRAIGQLLDVAGHLRLVAAAMGRLKRAGRLVAVVLGVTVVAWTVAQTLSYSRPERLEDLIALLRTKSLRELAIEQGVLAALTPLRDVIGLGDNLLLLVVTAVVVFKLSADRWSQFGLPEDRVPPPAWTTICWGGAWIYVIYRLAAIIVDSEGLPLGGCLFVEAGLIPLLMVLADGLLVAWVLVELRAAGPEGDGGEGLDALGAVALTPLATLACVAALPSRYVAAGAWLLLIHIPPGLVSQTPLPVFVRGWGLVVLQGIALTTVGLVGAVAWSRGGLGSALRGYGRLLRGEGGRLVGALALGGLACGGLSALSYALVLAMPAQPWLLEAADGYAHYATLPVGLLLLASLVELGARTRLVEPPLVVEWAEATPQII